MVDRTCGTLVAEECRSHYCFSLVALESSARSIMNQALSTKVQFILSATPLSWGGGYCGVNSWVIPHNLVIERNL